MIGTPAIRNLIRENKVAQMYSAIQTGQGMGMQTLDQNLTDLVRRNVISRPRRAARPRFPRISRMNMAPTLRCCARCAAPRGLRPPGSGPAAAGRLRRTSGDKASARTTHMERDQASKFINDLLKLMVSAGSDLFITADFPPAIKVDGKIAKVSRSLTPAHTRCWRARS
jgi:Tfp pilus assembly pilus retraction ATPase PilT